MPGRRFDPQAAPWPLLPESGAIVFLSGPQLRAEAWGAPLRVMKTSFHRVTESLIVALWCAPSVAKKRNRSKDYTRRELQRTQLQRTADL